MARNIPALRTRNDSLWCAIHRDPGLVRQHHLQIALQERPQGNKVVLECDVEILARTTI